MKKLIMSMCVATAAFAAFAETTEEVKKEEARQPEQAQDLDQAAEEAPLFWGFGSLGIYSGYQLYGSLLNNEPTMQGYIEGNMNLSVNDIDCGFIGVGVWHNSDLTARRDHIGIGNMFNEFDFNIHWEKTWWFDDNNTWGLTYRSYVVWYYYPGQHYQTIHPACDTTFDWDHYFELKNPYVIPYINVVREYRFDANLFQFGLKKPFVNAFGVDGLTLCPFIEMVARDSHYNWCFPTQFGSIDTCGGLATLKVELDATYMFSEHFGIFAKVAYCSIIDHHMRNSCDDILNSDDYGENKDFAWGGIGLCFNF